jgi:hypothetical protein
MRSSPGPARLRADAPLSLGACEREHLVALVPPAAGPDTVMALASDTIAAAERVRHEGKSGTAPIRHQYQSCQDWPCHDQIDGLVCNRGLRSPALSRTLGPVIAQLLNRSFVLSQAEAARDGLQEAVAVRTRREPASQLDDFDADELLDIARDLDAAIVAGRLEGEQGAQSRRSSLSMDEFAFLPRDPILSMLQTAIDEYVSERQPGSLDRQQLPDGRRGPSAPPVATDLVLKGAPMELTPEGRRQFEIRHPKLFSDPRYILSGIAMIRRGFKSPARFNDSAASPVKISDRARLVLVGDWGTGTARALKVATHMAKAVKDGKSDRRQVHVIHLGDVYYSGWKREYKERFLLPWPVKPGTRDVGSFTLNGNHDMYSGGHDYFGTALADPRFARQGGASYFALRNSHWQFLALDSSFDDAALHGSQVRWVIRQLSENPTRRTVLLSHHQLFSAYETGSLALASQIKPVLKTGRIDGWFWGHEHRCLVYGPAERVGLASCVGHGGVPEHLIAKEGDPLPKPLVYDYRKVWGDGTEPWDTFGFVCLDLDEASCRLTYVDEDGNPHYQASIPPKRS